MTFRPLELQSGATPETLRRTLNEAQRQIFEDLQLIRRGARQATLQVGDYAAQYGEHVRLSPPTAGAKVVLPPVNIAALPARVLVSVETATGPVFAECSAGNVNGLSSVTFPAQIGVIAFDMTPDGWWAHRSSVGLADGTYGDIVISGGGTDFQIAPGSIVNADVSASAAIVTSKLVAGTIQSVSWSGTINNFARSSDAIGVIRADTLSGDVILTGVVPRSAARDGELLIILNTDQASNNTLTLPSNDTGSTTSNRFRFRSGFDLVLQRGDGGIFVYDDSTDDRWFCLGTIADTSGGGGLTQDQALNLASFRA